MVCFWNDTYKVKATNSDTATVDQVKVSHPTHSTQNRSFWRRFS